MNFYQLLTGIAAGIAFCYIIDLAHDGDFDLPVIRLNPNWARAWAKIKKVLRLV